MIVAHQHKPKFDHVEIYEGEACLVDEISALASRHFLPFSRSRRHVFASDLRMARPHECSETFELYVLRRGRVDFWFTDDHRRSPLCLCSIQALLLGPNVQYTMRTTDAQPVELNWLRFRLPALRDRQEAGPRCSISARHVITETPDLIDALDRVFSTHRRGLSTHQQDACRAFSDLLVSLGLDDRTFAPLDRHGSLSPTIQQAVRWIDEHRDQKFNVDQVAEHVQIHPARLRQLFAQEVGRSPHDYLTRRRIAFSCELLKDTERSITQIAHELGYSSSQYFATAFRRITGMTPSDYRSASVSR
jgi:AraC-like DNA-binding protein